MINGLNKINNRNNITNKSIPKPSKPVCKEYPPKKPRNAPISLNNICIVTLVLYNYALRNPNQSHKILQIPATLMSDQSK